MPELAPHRNPLPGPPKTTECVVWSAAAPGASDGAWRAAFPGSDNLRTKEIPMVDRSWKWACAAAIALAALPALPASAGDEALKSLVAAERAFAALSLEQGIKPSFLKYLAPDGIVFRPTATNARKAIGAQRPSAATVAPGAKRCAMPYV